MVFALHCVKCGLGLARRSARQARAQRGFTLVEVLVATVVTLILMGMVVQIFGYVSTGVSASRAIMESTEMLRSTKQRLQLDLEGVTAPTIPPLDPGAELGYFEYIEGPIGPIIPEGRNFAANDTQVGDIDDVLMFTARAVGPMFVGRYGSNHGRVSTVSSQLAQTRSRKGNLAEIAWFVRGATLYRRVLLVAPGVPVGRASTSECMLNYFHFDVSMRQEGGALSREKPAEDLLTAGGIPPHVVGNTLGDLTMRENRYAHQPLVFPYDSRWTAPETSVGNYRPGLGLPTLLESSASSSSNGQPSTWPFPLYETDWGTVDQPTTRAKSAVRVAGSLDPHDVLIVPDITTTVKPTMEEFVVSPGFVQFTRATYDPWYTPVTVGGLSTGNLSKFAGAAGRRYEEDIILTGVLSFDVKAWDPGAPVLMINSTSSVSTPAVILPGDPGFATTTAEGALIEFRARPTGALVQMVGTGAYVDLNYLYHLRSGASAGFTRYNTALNTYETSLGLLRGTLPRPAFGGAGDVRSKLVGPESNINTVLMPCIYDTWSTSYERDGLDNDNDGLFDEGTNGIDDDGDGRIDEADEAETAPPYSAPLRGIQVKIRTFELDSRQVREVTVVHEFLPE